MKEFRNALEKLIEGFEGFTNELRDMTDDLPQGGGKVAGAGEEPAECVGRAYAPVDREDIDDDTVIKMRSGDLRQVVDAYRRLVRYAREGRIPSQDERFKLHRHIKKVKHLIRSPQR